MYSINTQLAHFICYKDAEPMLVNVTWYRIDRDSMQGLAFTGEEADAFMEFTARNEIHFPGQRFLQPSDHYSMALPSGAAAREGLPLYLVLSKSPLYKLDNPLSSIMDIILVNQNTNTIVTFTLDFDVVGKIEVYKKLLKG